MRTRLESDISSATLDAERPFNRTFFQGPSIHLLCNKWRCWLYTLCFLTHTSSDTKIRLQWQWQNNYFSGLALFSGTPAIFWIPPKYLIGATCNFVILAPRGSLAFHLCCTCPLVSSPVTANANVCQRVCLWELSEPGGMSQHLTAQALATEWLDSNPSPTTY